MECNIDVGSGSLICLHPLVSKFVYIAWEEEIQNKKRKEKQTMKMKMKRGKSWESKIMNVMVEKKLKGTKKKVIKKNEKKKKKKKIRERFIRKRWHRLQRK